MKISVIRHHGLVVLGFGWDWKYGTVWMNILFWNIEVTYKWIYYD